MSVLFVFPNMFLGFGGGLEYARFYLDLNCGGVRCSRGANVPR